jgi:hypothetical protein
MRRFGRGGEHGPLRIRHDEEVDVSRLIELTLQENFQRLRVPVLEQPRERFVIDGVLRSPEHDLGTAVVERDGRVEGRPE